MIVDVITIFPEMFDGPMSRVDVGLARERGLLELRVHDLRDWTHDRHRTTDDAPYGGGPGMVMKPEPIFEAVDAVQALDGRPRIRRLLHARRPCSSTSAVPRSSPSKERLVLVCGRYEGFDERVLSRGRPRALHRRLRADRRRAAGDGRRSTRSRDSIPGCSATRSRRSTSRSPRRCWSTRSTRGRHVFEGMDVPEVLLSGDHGEIAAWRREQSVRKTARLRPDLLARAVAHARRSDTSQATR